MEISKDISVRLDQIVIKDGSSTKAIASVTIGELFAVHGFRVMDSEKGLFVKMPQRSFKRGDGETQYTDMFHPITAEARAALNEAVLAAYTAKVMELSGEKDHADALTESAKADSEQPEKAKPSIKDRLKEAGGAKPDAPKASSPRKEAPSL